MSAAPSARRARASRLSCAAVELRVFHASREAVAAARWEEEEAGEVFRFQGAAPVALV
jgi:hypothetical protein